MYSQQQETRHLGITMQDRLECSEKWKRWKCLEKTTLSVVQWRSHTRHQLIYLTQENIKHVRLCCNMSVTKWWSAGSVLKSELATTWHGQHFSTGDTTKCPWFWPDAIGTKLEQKLPNCCWASTKPSQESLPFYSSFSSSHFSCSSLLHPEYTHTHARTPEWMVVACLCASLWSWFPKTHRSKHQLNFLQMVSLQLCRKNGFISWRWTMMKAVIVWEWNRVGVFHENRRRGGAVYGAQSIVHVSVLEGRRRRVGMRWHAGLSEWWWIIITWWSDSFKRRRWNAEVRQVMVYPGRRWPGTDTRTHVERRIVHMSGGKDFTGVSCIASDVQTRVVTTS